MEWMRDVKEEGDSVSMQVESGAIADVGRPGFNTHISVP